VTGIVPLFFGGALLSSVTAGENAFGSTQQSVQDIVSAFNNAPEKSVRSLRLLYGPNLTTISTRYSTVTLKITQVDDLSSLISASKDLQQNFYNLFDSLAQAFLNGATAANLKDRCAGFANLLIRNYDFTKKDNSFFLGYFAQAGFPASVKSRLDCIANKYNATDVVQYQFFYNKPNGAVTPLDLQSIKNHFADPELSGADQIDSSVARDYLERISNLISIFSQTPQPTAAMEASLTKWLGDGPISVDDLTTKFWSDETNVTALQFVGKIDSGFKKFGCFKLKPTIGSGAFDAIVLAMPQNDLPAQKPDNLIGLRIALVATGKDTVTAAVPQDPDHGRPFSDFGSG
jgi:hypothetical protein